MTHKIINADDFGMSKTVNTAIDYAFKNNIIQRTTIMVNMPYAEEAMCMAIDGGYIDKVGLHINLIEGKPLTSKIKAYNLFGNNEFWNSKFNLLYINKQVRNAIKEEVEAQIKKFFDLGGICMHIDSHYHKHTMPSIVTCVIEPAKKYGFQSMRISRNVGANIGLFKKTHKKIINYIIQKNFSTSKYFGGIMDYNLNSIHLMDNFEIMIHPEIIDGKYVDVLDRENCCYKPLKRIIE